MMQFNLHSTTRIIVIAATVMFASCNSSKETGKVLRGADLLKMTKLEIVEALGDPRSVRNSHCGTMKELYYGCHTIMIKDGKVVGYALRKESKLTTPEGIAIGDALATVMKEYGKSSESEDMRIYQEDFNKTEGFSSSVEYHGKRLSEYVYRNNRLLWYEKKGLLFVVSPDDVVVGICRSPDLSGVTAEQTNACYKLIAQFEYDSNVRMEKK